MRRKSERTATKKVKASPEKKVEKVKRTRTRRRKQSSSSENESDEGSPVREVEIVEKPEKEAPTTPVKQDSPEEGQDQEQEQVWQVKASESSTDIGEIQKLKICLTRPPSTPERADRSPRSKRKHSRATSSSDTPSTEGEEKRKSRRSKRSRESRDESEKNHDSQGDEPEGEGEQMQEKSESEVSQSTEVTQAAEETPVSTTNDDQKEVESVQQSQEVSVLSEAQNKSSDADTTVNSPEADTQSSRAEINTSESVSPKRDRSVSVEKSEVLEIHAEESKHEISEIHEEDSKKEAEVSGDNNRASSHREVSIIQEKKSVSVSEEIKSAQDDIIINNVETDVVESSEHIAKVSTRKMSTDSDKDRDGEESVKRYRSRELERSESTHSIQDEPVHNGQSAPIVVSRKRKWGARPKITTQKSITISTDVLKEIIPDVKPVEFEEVIEEKKHKRIEVTDKVERPLLPKIVIDNTENVEQNRKEKEEKEKEIIKKEPNLAANRRISIVKENDNVVIRPPSPPRHKQSNILYITNLVRPFTLPQLKNLLQRTGRIVENGFWIDRIKSKCFVQYENEDQAVETRHALHGVTWPVSNPKTLQVDFSTEEAFENARQNEDNDNAQTSTIPGTVEDWLREQDLKRERGEIEKPWERRVATREWDVGKNDKEKDKDRLRRDERPMEKRRHRSSERSPEPARKFKKKEEEAPAKLLDDLFRKTKTTPCIYWLPLSAETIAIKEEQRRQHMAEHERRLQELRRTTHRRH